MSSQIQHILSGLVGPPGNLVYHIILTFSVAAALQAGFSNLRRSGFPQARRVVVGLALLFGVRIALFLAAGAAWQGVLDEHLMPPLDRAFTLFSLVIVTWLWAFPEPTRMADAAAVLLSLLTFTLLALGLVWWSEQDQGLAYNGSALDLGGEVIAIVLLLGGILVLLLRRPSGWGFGLGMLLTLLAGHAIYLLADGPLGLPRTGDYPGPVRLFQLAAYPLLLLLPQRFPLPAPGPPPSPPADSPERRRYAADLPFVRAMLALSAESEPGQACAALTRVVAHAMLADVCLLAARADADDGIEVRCGFDLIRERKLSGTVLPRQNVPAADSVLQDGRPACLPFSSAPPDLDHLSQVFRLEPAGGFLAVPVPGPSEIPEAVIILLSPYSRRDWDPVDQATLSEVARSLAQVSPFSGTAGQPAGTGEPPRTPAHAAQPESRPPQMEREELLSKLLSLEEQYKREHSQLISLTALVKNQEEARLAAEKSASTALAALAEAQRAANIRPPSGESKAEAERLEPGLKPGQAGLAAGEANETAGELLLLLQEIARLKAALGETDEQTPASERGQNKRLPARVFPDALLQAAVHRTEDQRRSKNITLQAELPEHLPALQGDGESLMAVFIRLLRNAFAATPPGSAVVLRAAVQHGNSPARFGSKISQHIQVQVRDAGPGISPDDLPHIFTCGDGDPNPVIPGTGVPCEELAELRRAVEALDGFIAVDSAPGTGSIFSVLLPAAPPSSLTSAPPNGGTGGVAE